MAIERATLQSDVIKFIGFDPGGKVLEVEFQNGKLFQYLGVPRAIYERLLSAESHGAFFNQWVRDNYIATRIE